MKKRLLIRLAVALAIGLPLALGLAPARIVFSGLIRGERFYGGRPASYWREQVIAYNTGELRLHSRLATPLDWLKEVTRIGTVEIYNEPPPLYGDDPKALGVLMELLNDPNPGVRGHAVKGLSMLAGEPGIEVAVPLLEALLNDKSEGNIPNLDIGTQAYVALDHIKGNENIRRLGGIRAVFGRN